VKTIYRGKKQSLTPSVGSRGGEVKERKSGDTRTNYPENSMERKKRGGHRRLEQKIAWEKWHQGRKENLGKKNSKAGKEEYCLPEWGLV